MSVQAVPVDWPLPDSFLRQPVARLAVNVLHPPRFVVQQKSRSPFAVTPFKST
jgi:hypothetical protein